MLACELRFGGCDDYSMNLLYYYFIMLMGPAIGGKIKGERNCGYAQMEDSECAVEFNMILVQFEQWRKMQTKLA